MKRIKTNFALAREAMNLLETRTSDAPFENTEILFCVHIERLIVDGLIVGDSRGFILLVNLVEERMLVRTVKVELVRGRKQFHRRRDVAGNSELRLVRACDGHVTLRDAGSRQRRRRHTATTAITTATLMDSQLKALRVADLREILSKATVPFTSKVNKTDLIAKIIASQPAIDIYKSLYPPPDALLSPPEDVDWSNEQEARDASPAPLSVFAPPDPPKSATLDESDVKSPQGATNTNATNVTPVDEDPEAEKRRKRAERFGIPLVELPTPIPPRAQALTKRSPLDDPKKLEARATRFGNIPTAQKRSAPMETIDIEEQEKRRKRAERFGLAPAAP
ncbi:hypothetical protein D9615_002448 [Tricholomella constricta]|uniref:THO1-MOS11 C-terminal domain-containing protein n=1 Tax=Tricholomella constricta TaxID=117010 RepID=A0A8H5HMR2_9AGAR|nr:hypothetical protein D9615_002448 [Tricholomella constricta]